MTNTANTSDSLRIGILLVADFILRPLCVIGGECCKEREKVAFDDAQVALNDIATGQSPSREIWGSRKNGGYHLQWIFPLKMVIFHSYVAVYQRVSEKHLVTKFLMTNFNGEFFMINPGLTWTSQRNDIWFCRRYMHGTSMNILFAPIPRSQAGTSFPGAGVRTPVMSTCMQCLQKLPGAWCVLPKIAGSTKVIDRE